MGMDRLTDKLRQGHLWSMMFGDDILICSESRQQVKESLELEVPQKGKEGVRHESFVDHGVCR